MTLYGTFNAEGARETPMIDFIEFEFPKVSDVFVPNDLDNKDIVLSCDWDESDWDFDNKARIDTLQVSGIDTDTRFELTGLMIDDGGMMFSFPDDKIIPWMTEYAE